MSEYDHATRMWRLYDAMAATIRDEEWDKLAPLCSELTALVNAKCFSRSYPFTVGTMTIDRVPRWVVAGLLEYNTAVLAARRRKKAPQ